MPAPEELPSSIIPAAESTLIGDASSLSLFDAPSPTGAPVSDIVLQLESSSPSARLAQEVEKLGIAEEKEVADVGVGPVVQPPKGNAEVARNSLEKVKGKKKKPKKDSNQLSTKRELHILCIIRFVDQAISSPCGRD